MLSSKITYEPLYIFGKYNNLEEKTNPIATIFPVIPVYNINERYVDNPHFLHFQIIKIKIKRSKSVFISVVFLTILGLKHYTKHV